MDAHKYLYQFGNTKDEVNKFINQILNEIKEGYVEEYKFHGIVNALIKGLTKCLEANLENIDTSKKYEAYGFNFAPKESGVRFDFSNCNHPKWIELSQKEKDIQEQKKSIEDTLKSLREPLDLFIEDVGEVVKIYPAVKKSKTIIEVR